ncbi:hypothetical protein [Methylobacterium goesingense]|uniref:Uncharacterized protein n=1 Tax=Methylobacterium goesingense TaxID=243690 RepID=A0ABV2L1B3_9HYPH|nr:hypothetical protein [Methylobacterium goesingense]GJD74890.1 hypothetical protein CFIICLFH_3130 [Methylobacterium goesingense]
MSAARAGLTRRRASTFAGAALFSLATLGQALAQQMNPAPPIRESGSPGSNSAAANAAATDFNWIWASLVVAILVFAVWYMVRRRQSRR